MADCEGEVKTNEETQQSEAIQPETKSGWLLKRNKTSRKWSKKWFCLKERTIFYGDTPDDTSKSIPLDSCEITPCQVKGKNNTFCLKPKETQRKYFISAETETELHEWMQAICLAKTNGLQNLGGSQACVLQ